MVISPLTNQSEVSLLDEIPTSRLIAEWQNIFQINITNELRDCEKIELYRCDKTGLKFFIPPTLAGSDNLYTKLQKFDWYYMPWKWEHNIALSNMKKGMQTLEIGCGSGAFIKRVRNKGFAIEGIEVNSEAVAEAQRKNLPVSNTDLLDLANCEKGKFDIVCSFQVLEHVPDPQSFLNRCISLLKSGGKLILSVPNSESFLRYQFNLLDMPPHHMTRWSKKTLKTVETLFPLKLEKLLTEPLQDYQIQAYLGAYAQHLRSLSPLMKILVNRFTLFILSGIIRAGLKNLLIGQTLYVQFCKL